MNKIKVGVLGIGVIANSTYLPAMAKMDNIEMVAACDLIEERAVKASVQYNIPHVFVDQRDMLELDIDLVVNLTNIQAHFDTNLMSLQAGKHVYSEKTFAGNVEEATILIEEAKKQNVRLGAAAATMLNPTIIKIADLLERGAIGKVNFAVAHHSPLRRGELRGLDHRSDVVLQTRRRAAGRYGRLSAAHADRSARPGEGRLCAVGHRCAGAHRPQRAGQGQADRRGNRRQHADYARFWQQHVRLRRFDVHRPRHQGAAQAVLRLQRHHRRQ